MKKIGISTMDRVRMTLKDLSAYRGSACLNAVGEYLDAQEKDLMYSLIAASTHDDTNIVRGRIREVQALKKTLVDLPDPDESGSDSAEFDSNY